MHTDRFVSSSSVLFMDEVRSEIDLLYYTLACVCYVQEMVTRRVLRLLVSFGMFRVSVLVFTIKYERKSKHTSNQSY